MKALGLGTLFSFLLCGLVACTGDQGAPGQPGDPGTPGDPGDPGAAALAVTSVEPPGTNCANGGTKIEVGIDTNGNATLDASEITSTSYVCNGTSGGNGHDSLVRTTDELAGANCPFGGTKIETGLDANDDGVLQDTEVNAAATSYVCNIAPGGYVTPSTGVNVVITAVSTSTTAPITVRFTMKDDKGFPLDVAGKYSQNTAIQPRFALAYFTKDATTGIVSPLTVYTKSGATPQPTNYNPLGANPAGSAGTLVENGVGAGDYTYTFPTTPAPNSGPVAVAYDSTKLNETHVVWMQVTRQTDTNFTINANTFYAANPSYNFIPSGVGTPLVREIASQTACDACHAKFKAETTASAAFHGGGRVAVGMCNVCHNPGRTSNPQADSASFIHRIHNGEEVASANLFHGIAATFPRDVKDCSTCHGTAAQAQQAFSNPSTIACKGCHDYVDFTGTLSNSCLPVVRNTDPNSVDFGKPVPCAHVAGNVPSNSCASCHGLANADPLQPPFFPASKYHVPVAKPDPANIWNPNGLGTNANTNASYVAAGGYVPSSGATGAQVETITYDLKSVGTEVDASDSTKLHPTMTFRLLNTVNGVTTPVVFQTYAAGTVTELMPNFVGSPSAYFVWAEAQDGITSPADFNKAGSVYIKNAWKGTGATLTFASGYYTLHTTAITIPSTGAVMLTGGLGYTYSLSSAPPLVQTNLGAYPWTPAADFATSGKAQGGLSVPAPNVWKVASGFTGRRAIVDNAKCKNCHGALGVEPTFHAGQRNDGPTCSFCHNPGRSSSGWAAGSKYFIHAIHAGRKRTVDFTWHAAAKGPGYDEVEFPGTLNACTTCHVAGTYDFETAANLASLPNQQLSTAATGTLISDPGASSTYYTVSPYINSGTNYGLAGEDPNLVISPITGACSACHDTSIAINHMKANGGQFYATRGSLKVAGVVQQTEQCIICHGPGRVAAIGDVHQR
ncbi:MAG: OmcA/MtrC family decaheme c-type cytochrome [Deltaproteobacteria bacterium]|nr:OmcA/MtrC family decaheme c-type cytochrome [Deltaproteobacteria bacterium]